MNIMGGEAGHSVLYMYADQGDDDADKWIPYASTDSNYYLDCDANTALQNFVYAGAIGDGRCDGSWNDAAFDYAEFYKWKTPLASDGAIEALWGLSVILDGDFVRIAEAGEEDLVIGVVRPKHSTAAHGDGLKWQRKYKTDVWGNYEWEGYTHVNWQEFLPNGKVEYRHAYPKDEIPAYRLKQGIGRDKDGHTKEVNFKLDKDGEKIPVVVPSTAEEKEAANYIERTTHKTTGEALTRRVYSDTYDETQSYIRREDRPREWVLIGMLGQVPVRDTAIIPTHWKLMGNLASGIDKYFVK